MEIIKKLYYKNETPIAGSDVMVELEKIDGECSKYSVDFVYVQDNEEASEYGVKELPALIYFEDMIPSIYDGDLMSEEEVLEWLITQKTSDTIEQVSDRVSKFFIEEIVYLLSMMILLLSHSFPPFNPFVNT